MKKFKLQDLALKIDVQDGRDEALFQLHHKVDGVVAEADIITCGRTNPIGNGPAGGIEFDVRFDETAKFRALREALRRMLNTLDQIEVEVPTPGES